MFPCLLFVCFSIVNDDVTSRFNVDLNYRKMYRSTLRNKDIASAQDRLVIMQWNCNGLMAHGNELKQHISSSCGKYDIICLQETFLKPTKQFTIPGYRNIRRDRQEGAKGGLMTLVKENLVFSDQIFPNDIEAIVVKLKLKDTHLNIVNLYLSPNSDVDVDAINRLFDRNSVIVGDLNAKSQVWGSATEDARGKQIEHLLEVHNFVSINTGQPTYQHYSGQRSHLDVALVSNSLATKSSWTALNNTMGSDHSPTVRL